MKSKFTALILVASLLTACGGGGGGGGDDGKKNTTSSTTTTTSSAASTSVTANAGADITVNEGEKVTLNPGVEVANQLGFTSNTTTGFFELTGSSTKASDITKLKWAQAAGTPRTGFTFSGSPSEVFSFVAPDTGTADSIQIVYELTLTNAAGQTASDSITITVNRVNELPVANAGVDQTTESETDISLSGTASNDPDGTIESYAWVQTSGDEVVLTDADKATATFTAPAITETETYEFELTVTDNNDATAKDKIVITITPKDAPIVNIYFPTPVGVYKETTISAFGSAEAVAGNLHKVEVSTGGEFIEAEFDERGRWRLNNITVPETDTFEIIVKVTDSLGVSNIKKSVLKKSGSQGTGQAWTKMIALGVDNESQQLFAFASGTKLSDLRVFPIDLSSGNRGGDVSNFSNANQGAQTYVIAQAHYDAVASAFYYTLNPDAIMEKLQVNEVNVKTGQRKVIAENAQTLISPPASSFVNPTGITSNQQGQIFVADNGSGTIIKVEASSGVRTAIATFNGAVGIAMDPSQPNSAFLLPWAEKSFVVKALLDTSPITSSTVTNSNNADQGPVIGHTEFIEVDTADSINKLLLVDDTNQLFEADITTGIRTKIESVAVAGKGYDHERHLFYYNDSEKNAIWVLDPVSKHKVMISGSVD